MPAPKRKPPVRRKRTSDPNLEPGLAAATRRSRAPVKKAPVKKAPAKRKPFITATVPTKRRSATAELKSLQKQMKKMMDAMRPLRSTADLSAPGIPGSQRQAKKRAPARTSDPNLEPGVAAATKRAQAPAKKRAPAKAVRRYDLSAVSAKTGKRLASRKAERVSPPKKRAPSPPPPRRRSVKPVPMPKARIPPPRPGRPRSKPVPMPEAKVPPSRPGRRKIKPVPMPSGPGQQRPSPSKPTKKRALARPRAAAPKRAKPADSPYDTLGGQIPARRRRSSTASRKRLK